MIPLDRVRELSEGLADVESAAEVHDLARDVLALADALATAERERDTARASADRSAQAAVDAARELGHAAAQAVADRDAVRQAHAELARLRAAMGRTVPPTDAEWAAIVEHDCTLIVTAEPSMTTTVATRGELDALCDAADEAGEAYAWIVVGADGWPRPWPTGGDAGR